MTQTTVCQKIEESICDYVNHALDADEANEIARHIRTCQTCREGVERYREVNGLLQNTIGGRAARPEFTEKTGQKLRAELAAPSVVRASRPVPMDVDASGAEMAEVSETPAPASRWETRLGGAPWWFVSLALHILVIALASLISMAIELPRNEDAVIMLTELQSRAEIKTEDTKKPDAVDALASKEVQATDVNATNASDIVVPPDILAKAELGDHFETINPDLPDTHSALGNPEARMFHSVEGNTEAAGGGGMGGVTLDDMIGVGGAASPGKGGGWGGGEGTGIGVGKGAGKGSFGNRNGGGRKLMVMRHGGSKATESAVDKALEWLAYHQEADGHWDGAKHGASMSGDAALTGLATLAFLGAGHTEKVGKYKDNVKRAVGWIISKQDADGCVLKNDRAANGYNHPIASLALAEAAGMARVPETMEAAQKAVNYSVDIFQCGKGSDRMGWRYSPQEIGDVSTTGWFVMQLKSAKIAGLKVDPMAFEGATNFLNTLEVEKHKDGDPYSGHHYGYRADAGGQGVGAIRVKNPHCNTAIGCLIRLFLGTKPDEIQGAAEWFMEKGGLPSAQHPEYYHWYYATLSTFQVGGDVWKKWNEAIKSSLLELQCKGGGDNDGSFDPKGHSTEGAEERGGRVFTTAIGALCLEVYYRYAQLAR